METRRNSAPDTPSIPTHILNRMLRDSPSLRRTLWRWDGPVYQQYNTFAARRNSFPIQWHNDGNRPSPDDLSAAGFFHNGRPGETLCFHCGGGLKDWIRTDDPWYEHNNWFPHCVFITFCTRQGIYAENTSVQSCNIIDK